MEMHHRYSHSLALNRAPLQLDHIVCVEWGVHKEEVIVFKLYFPSYSFRPSCEYFPLTGAPNSRWVGAHGVTYIRLGR